MSSEKTNVQNPIAEGDTAQIKVIAPDQPIRHQRDDQFNRGLFATRIARTIALRQDSSSVVIGIYAPWGEGKTSILHFIEEALSEQSHVVPVWFNPWIFGTPQVVTQGFFAAVATALDKNIKTRTERVGEKLKQYGKWISAVGNLAGQSLDGVDELGASLSSVSIEEERARISKILRDAGKRVVVFMDDIDRLDKSEIQTVFKLIKLTADLEQIVYVLAFDDELVANALQERYGVGDPLAGRRFLEKIVQVPLRLPAAPKKTIRLYALNAVEQALQDAQVTLSQQQAEDYIHGFDIGLSLRVTTPRLAKLHANAMTFALPILAGEVDPVEAMLVEGLRVLYPALYELIRKEPQMFLNPINEFGGSYSRATEADKEKIKVELDQALKAYSSAEREAARKLLFRLFPRLKGVYHNQGHSADMDSVWAKEKRVAATQYFDRYFTYAIPLGDVSDREIESLLRVAESGSVDQVAEVIQRLVEPMNAGTFIGKLRQLEDSCLVSAGLTLSQALAGIADHFPSSDVWKMLGSRAQVAVFISEIIARIEDDTERAAAAKRVVTEASTPEFARDLIHWLDRPPKNQRHDEVKTTILPSTVVDQLTSILVEQIEHEAQHMDFLEAYQGLEARSVLYVWAEHSGRGATQAHLQQSIAGRPDKLLKFLSWYTGTGFNMSDGRPTWGSFGRESYDSISALIDPAVIEVELQKAGFGQTSTDGRTLSFEKYLAEEFLKIHAAVITTPPTGEGNNLG